MKEFTREEIDLLYSRLGLKPFLFGLDSDQHPDPENQGRKLFGLIEHPIFLSGSGIFLGYNFNTGHLRIYTQLVGSVNDFIIKSEKYINVENEKQVFDAHDKMMKDIYYYNKLFNDLNISNVLANLD